MRRQSFFIQIGLRNRFWLVFIPLGILALPWSAFCQESPKETGAEVSFEVFEIILNRNIFDPNRTTDRRKPSPQEEAAANKATAVEGASNEEKLDEFKSEEMALVGTIIDGPTAVAFFTSESSDFKTVAQRGEMVGEFRLAEIRTEHVKLESEGKTIQLPVGSRMSSQRNGDWIIALNSPATPKPKNENPSEGSQEGNTSNPPEGASGSSSSTPSPASGDGTDDVLKRLMERRRKALEK